jgi:hypothetical protein
MDGVAQRGIGRKSELHMSRDKSAKKPEAAAAFILAEAADLGIRVGTDGVADLLMLAPCAVPIDVIRELERALNEHRSEVIAIIQAEAGGRA